MPRLIAEPLTRESFQSYGDVIDCEGEHYEVNSGKAHRFHSLAPVVAEGPGGHPIISIFRAMPFTGPVTLKMVERHPFGSQAFMPMAERPFLVVVFHDGPNGPTEPRAFVTKPGQGVNYPRNSWHAPLMPLDRPQDFLVVDREGEGSNTEVHDFAEPWEIHLPGTAA